jgi:tRNA threonylcarbamoyladenosine biosynthesis protein TsaB
MVHKIEEVMKILAIETSADICSVAISTENFFGEYSVAGKNLHDIFLAEFVRRILKDSKIKAEDLDYVAISSGPGSFTGLRIGAALVKGLCYGTEKPKLLSVPTMDAYAWSALYFTKIFDINQITAIIPSNKNKYYMREFDNQAIPTNEILIINEEEKEELVQNSFIVGPDFKEITGRDIIEYAKSHLENTIDADKFEPLYVQDFTPTVSPKKLSI